MSRLGIVAGGGDLPRAVAEAARSAGREVFVVALAGYASEWVADIPHEKASIGEAGKIARALAEHDCKDILLVGQVNRPRFSDLKLDTRGAMLVPRIAAAALKGDDALLRVLVNFFEEQGCRVVSVAEAAPSLLCPEGRLGALQPAGHQSMDIARGFDVVRRLGELDVGQAAIVCEGLVLAVEAAQGTDAMLSQIATLPEAIRGSAQKRRGVLVKAVKPVQDGKTDLPVIGVGTVRNAAAAGLCGIAVEAGRSLVVDRAEVAALADKAGLFVVGVTPAQSR